MRSKHILLPSGYVALFLSAVWLICCRFAVFYYNSKYIPLSDGLLFTSIGVCGDTGPLWCCLLSALLLRSRVLTAIGALYLVLLLLLDTVNAVAMYQAKIIFSYDLFLQVKGNTGAYTLEIACACGLMTLLGLRCWRGMRYIVQHTPRHAATWCLLGLLCLAALSITYYEMTKDKVFFKGYGTREWVVRPAYVTVFDFFVDRAALHTVRNAEIHAQDQDGITLRTAAQLLQDRAATVQPLDTLIVVAVESLDLAYLHSINPVIPAVVTRELDALAQQYTLFSNFFTAAQPTTRGLHALIASRLDYEADPFSATPSIFTSFAEAGYGTWFISGISGHWGGGQHDIRQRYQPQHALFAEYLSQKYDAKILKWGLDSRFIFTEAIDILSKAPVGQKNFLFLSTIDTHPNYGFVPEQSDACWQDVVVKGSPFLLSLCHIDRAIGDFVAQMQQRGLLSPRTLIAVTADHSATQGANYTNRSAYTPDRIPLLLISGSPSPLHVQRTQYVSQLDLAPTLLTLCGIMPPATFMGADMRRPQPEAVTLLERGILRVHNPAGTQDISIKQQSDHPLSRWFSIFYSTGDKQAEDSRKTPR